MQTRLLSLFVAFALVGFAGCATIKPVTASSSAMVVDDTPGSDPEPLQALLYKTPPGVVHCMMSSSTTADTVSMKKVHCVGRFGVVSVSYDDDPNTFHEQLWITMGDDCISFVDDDPTAHRDGRAAVSLDKVLINEVTGTRFRTPRASDQHLFDLWRGRLMAQPAYHEASAEEPLGDKMVYVEFGEEDKKK